MKRKIVLILTVISICIQCQYSTVAKEENVNDSLTIIADEKFEEFILDFSTDTSFQISRIKFPLEYVSLDENYTELVSKVVNRKDYQFIYVGIEFTNDFRFQIYDNFEHKLRETDERVVGRHGLNNGNEVYLYFKRIDGKWFLVKFEDLST